MQDKYKAQTKELRDAMMQRKMAMDEFTEINVRLADIRSQKTKVSRQLRDLEEEMEDQRQKMESLRGDLRKSEKSKREVCKSSYNIKYKKVIQVYRGFNILTASGFFESEKTTLEIDLRASDLLLLM